MRDYYARFVQPNTHLLALVVTLLLAYRLLLSAGGGAASEDAWERYATAKTKHLERDNVQLVGDSTRLHARDSALTVAARRQTVRYLTDRRAAVAAVAALPAAEVHGDTVTVAGTSYVAPVPVVELLVQQRAAIAQVTVAVASADSALRAQDALLAAQDSTLTTLRALAQNEHDQAALDRVRAEQRTPRGGFLATVQRTCVAAARFAAAFGTGYLVARVLP